MPAETQTILETHAMYPIEPAKEELDKIIRRHVAGSIGIGLIPIPLVDLVALTGIQIHMVHKLAKKYAIPFSRDKAKNIIASLIGSFTPTATAPTLAMSLSKMIPFFGSVVGAVTMPALSGAVTYAIGRVFVQHFASGGTFLTFNPEKVKDYYMEMFEEGERVAAEMKQENTTQPEVHEQTAEPKAAEHFEESQPEESKPESVSEEPPASASKDIKEDVPEQNIETTTPEKKKNWRSRKKKTDLSES